MFGTLVNNDQRLRDLRWRGIPPVWRPSYEIVILDELQDLTELLYWLVCTLLSNLAPSLSNPPQLLVLGDPRQAIYEFRGADARYLELAYETFSDISPYHWKPLQLANSFRLSHQTANFVNTFIGDAYINGSHNGPDPIYLNADIFDVDALLDHILPIIHKYSPENCAIVAPSLRNNPPLALLTNVLSLKHKIPVAVSAFEEAPLDLDVLRGKVAVSTYHQFKGSERKAVIVYGADASYFDFLGRDLPDDRCPNATFVALTRACEQLVVVQSHELHAMPFVSWSEIRDKCEFVNLVDQDPLTPYKPGRPLQLGLSLPENARVTELPRHVPEEILDELVKKYVHIKELASPLPEAMCINAPSKVLTDKRKQFYELVSDLSGLAVTAALEWKVSGRCTTFAKDSKSLIPSDPHLRSRWFAEEATRYEASQSNYKSRLAQMKGHPFDWLDDHLDVATARLSEQFLNPALLKFEVSFSDCFRIKDEKNLIKPYQETKIRGRVDVIESAPKTGDPPTIWEIKFVSSLSLDHVIQAVVYAYLWAAERVGKQQKPQFPRLIVFNIRDGTKLEILTTFEKAMALTEGLLRARYTASGTLDTHSFLKRCEKIRQDVVRKSQKGRLNKY